MELNEDRASGTAVQRLQGSLGSLCEANRQDEVLSTDALL